MGPKALILIRFLVIKKKKKKKKKEGHIDMDLKVSVRRNSKLLSQSTYWNFYFYFFESTYWNFEMA